MDLGAYAHSDPNAIGVYRPGGRDRDEDINDHKAHGQETDAEIRDSIIRGGNTRDWSKGDPQELINGDNKHECKQHDPSITVDFEISLFHRIEPLAQKLIGGRDQCLQKRWTTENAESKSIASTSGRCEQKDKARPPRHLSASEAPTLPQLVHLRVGIACDARALHVRRPILPGLASPRHRT